MEKVVYVSNFILNNIIIKNVTPNTNIGAKALKCLNSLRQMCTQFVPNVALFEEC